MRTYETVFILKPELTAEEQEKHIAFYKENITNHGGEIIKVDVWGKQQLAYPIDNRTEGFYVLIQFKAETDYANAELEKRFQFNEDVMRYVIVMLDEKRFKQSPRKEPVRRERPAGEKAGKSRDGEEDFDDNEMTDEDMIIVEDDAVESEEK